MNREEVGRILRVISQEIENHFENINNKYFIGVTASHISKIQDKLQIEYHGHLGKWNNKKTDFEIISSKEEAKTAIDNLLDSIKLRNYEVKCHVHKIKKIRLDWNVTIIVEVKNL